MSEIRPECKEWLIKLTEAICKIENLESNHYTEMAQKTVLAANDRRWLKCGLGICIAISLAILGIVVT